jgi:GxxExxY protein
MVLELEETTGQIIGAAIEVHKQLGPGFLETVYESALVIELDHRGIPFTRQKMVPISYRGIEVGFHRLDLFVNDEIVVELKVVKEIAAEHFAVVRSYLRAVGREHGLLLNLSRPTLAIKRVFASPCVS